MASELIRATEEYQLKIADKQRENDELLSKIRTNEERLETYRMVENYLHSITKLRSGNQDNFEAKVLQQENNCDILMKRLQLLNKWDRLTTLSKNILDQTEKEIFHHDDNALKKIELYLNHSQEEVKQQLQYNQVMEHYKQEIHEMDQNLEQLETKITTENVNHTDLSNRLKEYTVSLNSLQNHNETVSKKLSSVQIKLQTLSKENDDILKRSKTVRQDITNRKDELQKIQIHVQTLRQQIQQKEFEEHQRMVIENNQKYRQQPSGNGTSIHKSNNSSNPTGKR